MQKAKWLSEEALQIAVKRRDVKRKEETYGCQRGWMGGRDRESGIDMYTMFYLKWITNKVLLCYTVGPYWLNTEVCTCQSQTPYLSLLPTFLAW